MESRRFTSTTTPGPRGRLVVPVPFDPDEVWGAKPTHHVTGTVAGHGVRAVVEAVDGVHVITLGPAWVRDRPVAAGAEVEVELAPEGPQRGDLAPDLAAALDASREAGAFFDSLAQFYRRAYLRWIDATTRRPDERTADRGGRRSAGAGDQGARSVSRVISGGEPTRTGGPQNPVPRVT